MNPATCRLSVPRPGLLQAFRLVRKLCRPKRGEEAILSFDGACLHIDCGGMTVAPGAQGDWSGQVRFPADSLVMLAKLPPAGDPLEFSVRDRRLHVGSCSVACAVQHAWTKSIELPVNADLAQILGLHLTYTPDEIEAAGYSRVVDRAKSTAERRIAKAAEALGELRIEPGELHEWAYATLRRKLSDGSSTR